MTSRFRSPSQYLSAAEFSENPQNLARRMFRQACRLNFEQAGFALAQLGTDGDSRRLRQWMLDILDSLTECSREQSGRELLALSMSRFNQQATTKPHRDGGPAESLLLLGYEPTPIDSRLSIADYSRCAFDLGLTPTEFLDRHNPMFPAAGDLLKEYTIPVSEFDPRQYQILLINNSSADFDPPDPRWQGVLHQATIPHPREDAVRAVNSVQLTPAGSSGLVPMTDAEREQFLTDDALGRQYGRQSA